MRHIESPSTPTAASVLLAVSIVLSAVACGHASKTVPVEGPDSGAAIPRESSALFSAGCGIEPVKVDLDGFRFVAASISEDLIGDAAGTAWSLSVQFDLSEDTAASGDTEARGSGRFRPPSLGSTRRSAR